MTPGPLSRFYLGFGASRGAQLGSESPNTLVARIVRQPLSAAHGGARPAPALGGCFLQALPSLATVSPWVVALLSHGFLFAIADSWQQLQKQ